LKIFTERVGQNRGHDERKTRHIRSREICPGGVGFENRSASGGWGAVLIANSTRAGLHGVSVLVIGNWLGLQFSKPDDKHVNANGEFMGLKRRETPTNIVVAQNHGTLVSECVFDIQRVTKALCATFCATFGVEIPLQMMTLEKATKTDIN
jgi:hypothetical protein